MRGRVVHIALLSLLLAPDAHAQFDRDWKVFVVPFSHIDVGYTAPVPTVLDQHHAYLDSVLVYLDRTAENAPGERFKWTVEVPWPLPSYIANESSAQVEALMERVRTGAVEIGALHFNLQSDLASSEELVRALYYAQALRDTYDVPIRTAVINDTPGFTWALAQLLPASGIPYLAVAMNSVLSEFYQTTDLPHLFYWEAQSGDRVLVWRSIHEAWAYLEGAIWGLYGSYAQTENGLTGLLEALQDAGYPYDAILVNAATGDNGAPDLQVVENARQWNAQHADAKVIVSTFSDFFDYVAEQHADAIPTVRGDAPNWWTWGLATSSTGGYLRARQVQDLLPTAETMAAVASAVAPGFDYPTEALQAAYIDALLFSEHTFGSANPSGHEEFWTRKMGWVDAAYETAATTLSDALDAWGSAITTGETPGLAVFNPSAWPRADVVTFALDAPHVPSAFDLVDARTGVAVPFQVLSDGTAAFTAADVPALGHRHYRLVPAGGSLPPPQPLDGTVLENDRYRVALDLASGSVTEVFDKALGQVLTRPGGRFNTYLYNGSQTPTGMQVVRSDSGAVLQRVVLRGSAPGSEAYETEVVLYDGLPRIDFRDRYDKLPPTSFEGVDFRFDFGLTGAQLGYEIPFGDVRLFDDELSGFRVEHYAAQRWFGVTAGSGGPSAVLATTGPAIHAHNTGAFDGGLRLIASFNTSGTGYRAGVGELAVDFALTSHADGLQPERATRFATSVSRPLRVRVLPAGQSGPLADPTFSFLEVEEETLLLTTFKRSERGGGFVARLYNPTSEPVTARLAAGVPVRAATATTPLEVDDMVLSADGSGVPLMLGPHEVRTVRLELAVPTSTEGVAVASGLRLEQNYPNPFRPSTTIAYYLNRPARTRLVVYDVIGRQVAVLADGLQPAGLHRVTWPGEGAEGRPAASGIYFYTLEATVEGDGPARQTRSMVLLR